MRLKDKIENAFNEARILILGGQVLIGAGFRSVQIVDIGSLWLMTIGLGILLLPAGYHFVVRAWRKHCLVSRTYNINSGMGTVTVRVRTRCQCVYCWRKSDVDNSGWYCGSLRSNSGAGVVVCALYCEKETSCTRCERGADRTDGQSQGRAHRNAYGSPWRPGTAWISSC
jgi:hypothetical protein